MDVDAVEAKCYQVRVRKISAVKSEIPVTNVPPNKSQEKSPPQEKSQYRMKPFLTQESRNKEEKEEDDQLDKTN
jgi:hypothetical protein